MSFFRTTQGLGNEHLFYDVDWVVYCEGVNVEKDSSTLDELFWTRILAVHSLRFICKSFGSKSELLPLANEVAADDVNNVLVALDRDYDHLTGTKVEHPRVLYTHGYSWESDVCVDPDVSSTVQLFVNLANTDRVAAEFLEFRRKQSNLLRRVFALDFKYFNHERKLFDRGKPSSIISVDSNTGPRVDVGRLLRTARGLPRHQAMRLPRDLYMSVCGMSEFFGKVVGRLVYRWFVWRTTRMSNNRRVYYNAFMALLISGMDFSEITSVPTLELGVLITD